MGKSSSDSDSSYRRKKNKKYSRRSRSRSSSEEKRSRSRKSERRRSRSRERGNRPRSRRDRSHDRRSRSRERRSRSRERRSRSRERRRSHSRDHSKQRKVSPAQCKWDITLNMNDNDSLDSKVDDLSIYKPSIDEIAKIDQEKFVQQNFSSSFNPQQLPPTKQKKKKKKKQQQQKQQQQLRQLELQKLKENVSAMSVIEKQSDLISHENAIFGTTSDTMHVGKFSSRINNERKELLKKVETEDLIFGPMFFEDSDKRKQRWIEKISFIRKKLRMEMK